MGKFDSERKMPLKDMSIHPLMEECKERGIKVKVGENATALRKKIAEDNKPT